MCKKATSLGSRLYKRGRRCRSHTCKYKLKKQTRDLPRSESSLRSCSVSVPCSQPPKCSPMRNRSSTWKFDAPGTLDEAALGVGAEEEEKAQMREVIRRWSALVTVDQ